MKKRNWLIVILLLIPTFVYAKSSGELESDNILAMFGYSMFISLFHYVFIILPLKAGKKATFESGFKKVIKEYSCICVLNFVLVSFIGIPWYIISFFLVFVVGFPVMFISGGNGFSFGKVNNNITPDPKLTIPGCAASAVIRCVKCNAVMRPTDQFCPECGEAFAGDNAKVEAPDKKDMVINLNDFDSMYSKPEDDLIHDIIVEEMKALELDVDSKMVPAKERTRLIVLNIIFSILLFLFIGLIFYHVSIPIYIAGLVILLIFFINKSKIDLLKYINKEVKARPNENIDNIIGSIKENLVPKRTIISGIVLPILVIIGCVFIFKNPIIIYEPIEDGYAMRFYFAGWSNLSYATIPESHNGKPVTSLRGNAFSNMPYLKEVYLPDSITEIRGEAFKNDISLVKVHLPANLTYLGGESFFKCYSLKDINLTYDTPLAEIKGDTFEECHSLTEITIPDSVTRIGGHAFYNDYNLATVNISENSKINEIGSSAFRLCKSLNKIKIPKNAAVDLKAFKESPTKIEYFSDSNDYYNPVIDDNDKLASFLLLEGESTIIHVQNMGELYITNYSYNKTKNIHVLKVTGYKSDTLNIKEDIMYKLNDYYYILLEPSNTTSAVYGYIKKYNK